MKFAKIFSVFFATMFFVPNIFSTAQAGIETFEGTGSYPVTDDKTHGEVKEFAKKEAVRDALEKAGVAVFSQTQVENSMVTKDVIKVTAGSILKILSDKYVFVPLDDDDGIGMYKATVTISIDTDELNLKLNDFLNRESNEQSTLKNQYEELQKLNDANTKRIAELEKQLSEKNSELDKQQIKNEITAIDNSTLYAQKIDEGLKYYWSRDLNNALKIFDEAIKLNPNDYQGYFGRGTICGDLQNYSQSIADLDRAAQLNPNFSYIYYNRGVAYINLQNYEQAIEDFSTAIKLTPNFSYAYYNRGIAYSNLQNYEQAVEDFSLAIEFIPNFLYAYYNRGIANYYLQNYSQSIEDISMTIQLNPNFAYGYYSRGICYQTIGQTEKAQADFARAAQLGYTG